SLDNFRNAVPMTSLPFPSPFTSNNGFFTFSISALGLGAQLVAGHTDQNLLRQINLVDGLSVQRGSHGIKVGLDFRRLTPMTALAAYFQGAFFSDVPSAETGNSFFGYTYSTAN